jgi:putative endopeptidase
MVRIDALQRRHQNPHSHLKISSKSLHAKIVVPSASNSIRSGNDFYTACNEKWLKETRLPPYLNTYSVSEELDEYLEPFLYEIAQGASRKIVSRGEEAQAEAAIGKLILSATSPEKQRNSVEFLKNTLRSLGCMRDHADLGKSVGSMIRRGINTFINIKVDITFDAGKRKFFLMIEPGSLGIPNPHDLGNSKIRKHYRSFLEFISKEFDLGIDLSEAEALEVVLAPHLQKYKDELKINFFGIADLKRKFSAVPWDEILHGMGVSEQVKRVAVISTQWLSIVNSLFQKLTLQNWMTFLGMYIAVHGAKYLPEPFDRRYFHIFKHELEGQAEILPKAGLTMEVLKNKMSKYMSYFFVKRYIDPKEKIHAMNFVDTIFVAAVNTLSKNEWIESSTRKHLIKKMAAMNRAIYYPEQRGIPTGIPELTTEIFLENIYRLNATAMDEMLVRLHKEEYKGMDWIEPVYKVNAYYYQDINEIVVPAANFLWPFYDSARLGWSYGGLGCIIGHELIHAFDEEGKDINEHGEVKSMWTKGDLSKYKKKLDGIIKLFNKVKIGTVHLNGALTASENFADLGGTAIALAALEEALAEKKVSAFERLTEIRDFFTSYAVSWRTKSREKRELQDVYLDKHAPPKSRVNLVVSQFDAWYEAFQVVPGDELYIRPEERIRIF